MRAKLFFILLLFLVLASEARISIQRPSTIRYALNPNASSIGLRGPGARSGTAKLPTLALEQSRSYGQLPLSFEINQGQTDSQVQFLSRGNGCTLFLTNTEAVWQLPIGKIRGNDGREFPIENRQSEIGNLPWELRIVDFGLRIRKTSGSDGAQLVIHNRQSTISNRQWAAVRMKLVGANPSPEIEGLDRLPGISNYFLGNNPKKWRTNIPNYSRVRYRDVYPSIDLVYYGKQGQLEYDLVVAPGADPNSIKLAYEGVEKMQVDAEGGDLVLEVAGTKIRQHKPRIYQETDGARKEIDGEYVLAGNQQVGFHVGSYDLAKTLVIDPVLIYSTFLGGSNIEQANGIAVDDNGDAYVIGYTSSIDFPTTPGAYQTKNSGGDASNDVFAAKLNPAGNALLYSTYLGGTLEDNGYAIAVDTSGNAYLSGNTTSANFPITSGAFQTSYGGGTCFQESPCPDAFITKLNPSGDSLVYSTYLGGNSSEYGFGIKVDASGNSFVTGFTESPNFPTTAGAFQRNFSGTREAFVTKLNSAGSGLAYSTYLGGSDLEQGLGISVDSSGNAYVTGQTRSTNFPVTSGVVQPAYHLSTCGQVLTYPCSDAFVTKLNSAGSRLLYSTYLGGSDNDGGAAISVDSSSNALVTGFSFSADFPTTPSRFATPTQAAFVAKLDASASAFVYSIVGLGGNGVAVDSEGNAYVTGNRASVEKVNSTGSALLYSTCLAGRLGGTGYSIAVDGSGSAYVAGAAYSDDFTTLAPLQDTFGGNFSDAFVAKLADPDSIRIFVPIVLSSRGANNSFYTSELTLTNRGSKNATLDFTYAAAVGGGSGTATDSLPGGQQRIFTDTIAYLRSIGIPIPDSGDHQGTLAVKFSGLSSSSDAAVTARTTTAVAKGRVGLAYSGISAGLALTGPSYLCGLRQNATDRSNVAIQNAGSTGEGNVGLRLTVFSGDPNAPLSKILPDVTLGPGEFKQFNSILASNGMSVTNGYVRVERVGGAAPYYAYAVINDQINSDGSFVTPLSESALAHQQSLAVPVILEGGSFSSELMLTNWSTIRKRVFFTYLADAIGNEPHSSSFTVDLDPSQQIIIPDLVQWMRDQAVEGIGPPGPTYVGSMFVFVDAADVNGIFVGARTSIPGGGGRYGLSYVSVPPHNVPMCATSAWLFGLQQNEENRSNLALVNAQEPASDPQSGQSTFSIDLFDGNTGKKVRTIEGVTLAPGHWLQISGILSQYAPDTLQGYASVTRTLGTNPFIAYAVINDGASPGQRTGDGAFISGMP